ncbi:hypothetical protein F2P81_001789 [Scophthalmus maximus]|uniref:Uncharacterized protein n=1 Tax=Scophthalmus maximus TaxID=52904 RepID=A0A6A4TP07_SCOMX|nr:hypothetical protein F2P81_001789 [Scophthalmus maximus]
MKPADSSLYKSEIMQKREAGIRGRQCPGMSSPQNAPGELLINRLISTCAGSRAKSPSAGPLLKTIHEIQEKILRNVQNKNIRLAGARRRQGEDVAPLLLPVRVPPACLRIDENNKLKEQTETSSSALRRGHEMHAKFLPLPRTCSRTSENGNCRKKENGEALKSTAGHPQASGANRFTIDHLAVVVSAFFERLCEFPPMAIPDQSFEESAMYAKAFTAYDTEYKLLIKKRHTVNASHREVESDFGQRLYEMKRRGGKDRRFFSKCSVKHEAGTQDN